MLKKNQLLYCYINYSLEMIELKSITLNCLTKHRKNLKVSCVVYTNISYILEVLAIVNDILD